MNFGLVDGLLARGAKVEVVAEHLSQGEQLAFYAESVNVPPLTAQREKRR